MGRGSLKVTYISGTFSESNEEACKDDRFFALTAQTITFRTGNGNQEIFIIDSVERSVIKNQTVFTINYSDTQGIEFKLTFYYSPNNGGMIRFINQQHIEWFRIDKTKA